MVTESRCLLQHLGLLAKYFLEDDLKAVITTFLMELGFNPGKLGYKYLVQAVLIYYEQSIQMLDVKVYTAVAEYFGPGVTDKSVESAIRTARWRAWKNREGKLWELYIANVGVETQKAPTNNDLIAALSCVLGLWVSVRRNLEIERQQKMEQLGQYLQNCSREQLESLLRN